MDKQAAWRDYFGFGKNNKIESFITKNIQPTLKEVEEIVKILNQAPYRQEHEFLARSTRSVLFEIKSLIHQINSTKLAAIGAGSQMIESILPRLVHDFNSLEANIRQMDGLVEGNDNLKGRIFAVTRQIDNVLDFLRNYSQFKEDDRQFTTVPVEQEIAPVFKSFVKQLSGYSQPVVDVQAIRGLLDRWLRLYGAQAMDETNEFRGRYIQLSDFLLLLKGQEPNKPSGNLRKNRAISPDYL